MATALMLGAVACGHGDPETAPATIEATFLVQAEGLGTKVATFSQGTSATELHALVYDADGDLLPSLSKVLALVDKQATFSAKLVKGQRYSIAFWAQVPGAEAYVLDASAATVTASASGDANDEKRDAFYRLWNNGGAKVTGPVTETIVLTRPFAQVNVLAAEQDILDAAGSGVTFAASSMTVQDVPDVLHLLTGIADGSKAFTYAKAPVADYDPADVFAPYTGAYYYIAMNYLFANDADDVHDLSFAVWKEGQDDILTCYTVSAVPVRRNYRTNIIGDIFSVDAEFLIVIDNEFEKPDIIVQ